jgi:hypothetical protein
MDFEPDYSIDEPEGPADQQQADTEPSAGAEEPQVTEDDAAGGVEAGAALQSRLRAGGSGATPPPGDAVPEEWQVMDVPEDWRPRPMVRIYGLPAATMEDDLMELLAAQQLDYAVRSVVFDPRQCTPASKVALVRFEPPPLPDSGAAAGEHDAGKVSESLIAALRAKALQLHGAKVNVEKTGAEVCLFLSNLRDDDETDEGLRSNCEQYGMLERCFVVRAGRCWLARAACLLGCCSTMEAWWAVLSSRVMACLLLVGASSRPT